MPTAQFNKNRESFPLDELAKYEGKWVAFSPDGTKSWIYGGGLS